MTFLPNKYLLLHSVWIALFCLLSCKSDEPKAKVAISTFSMRVNGQEWKPFEDKNDPCSSTYAGISGGYGDKPLFTIYAYRDPTGRADAYSKNLLRLQITNVTKPGTYPLDGTYKEDFDSYFLFVVQQPTGKSKFYVNDPKRSPFVVNVTEIPVKKGYVIPGLKGSFSGILYNEADPSESIVIEQGAFSFDIMSARSDRHCGF